MIKKQIDENRYGWYNNMKNKKEKKPLFPPSQYEINTDLTLRLERIEAKLDIIVDYVQEIQQKESVRLIKG